MEHKMKFNSIIVRYGEISLKGKNRKSFELKLKSDIVESNFSRVVLKRGRIYIRGIDTVPELEKIMGVHSYSPALEIARNMETLEKEVLHFIPTIAAAKSFRVSCQRVDKRFPVKSVDLEQAIGHMLHIKSGTPVKLKMAFFSFGKKSGGTGGCRLAAPGDWYPWSRAALIRRWLLS
jgi:thiamine biosynthesis protein ThiI